VGIAELVALVAVGLVIGAYATSTGSGGGFLITPLLLVRHPDAEPATVTMASLTVVAITSVMSTAIVSRERIVDRRLVGAMAVLAVPAALVGAAGTQLLPREGFAIGFAAFLAALAAYIAFRPTAGIVEPVRRAWDRRVVTRDGDQYVYRVPVLRSIIPNMLSASLSALAGIGGGPVGVPVMTRIMRVPHAVAVPSMHVLIAVQSISVVTFHSLAGNVGDPLEDVPFLALGVIIANPIGQRLRRRLGEGTLMRALALGLLLVAARTAAEAL
jgi:uncharacterized membrane protein YfcA